MKKLDLVRLINANDYSINNLKKDMHGVLIKVFESYADVLFFNPQNIGDYAIVTVKMEDIILENDKLPFEMQKEILSKIDSLVLKAKNILEPIEVNNYDMVELLVEDNKYSKYGIHKGDTGTVMDNNAVQNYIEVDFSGIDENGNFYGDCISVKISDLKVNK